MTTFDSPRTTGADVIGVAELRRLRSDDPGVRLIDVRTGAEFEATHIPGSTNVPVEMIGEHAAEFAAVDHPIVLICASGGRATSAHTSLRTHGKQAIHVLEGGIHAWEAAGGDVVHPAARRWAMDRQIRLVAGSLSMIGLVLSLVFSSAIWLTAFVAGGLIFSAVSNICVMAQILAKLPYNQTDRCDIAAVLTELQTPTD